MRLFEVANRGIPRSQMPQIHVADIKDDFDYRQGKLSLKKMKPVQTERVESEYKKAVQKIKNKQAKPILLDKNLRIVNGHHRYDAYRHLGFDSVPAVIVDATLEDLMSKYQHTSNENLNYYGNCTQDDVVDYIFGDVSEFARQVELHGDEFEMGDVVVKYDAEEDIHHFYIDENFADGKVKGKSRPGRVKKAGASCKGSVSSLRAKAKKYSGERGKMYHWCANMKGGKKK